MMGSVVPKQPTVKPAAIGGLSKTIDKSKPKEEKKSLEKTQPSKKTTSVSPATRVEMMPLPGQKNQKDSFAEDEVKAGDQSAPKKSQKPSGGIMSFNQPKEKPIAKNSRETTKKVEK
jgi:hypothetical protein